MTPILITIPFSHFCEKARWALDSAGVAYREEPHFPGAHRRATARHGGKSVPVLVTDEGALVQSNDILRYAESRAPEARRLFPAEHAGEIDAWIARFDREVGPSSRLLAYHHLLPMPARLLRVVGPSFSRLERLELRIVLPFVRPLMLRAMKITAANAERSVEKLRACFREVGEGLRDGYLVGGRFTAADLVFAALAAPAILPPGHGYMSSDLEPLPGPLRALVEELRATTAGAHVAAMYARFRGA